MANPLLDSFRASPRKPKTNSICPLANLKGKEDPDLPSNCSNYWPPILAQFVF